MDGYKLTGVLDCNHDTLVTLRRATSNARDDLPVVLKEHEFREMEHPETQERITSCINAALNQAKVQHPNICDILEVQFKAEGPNCFINHVLESMETSVARDIKESKVYSQEEMVMFLKQTASALAFAHSKVRSTQRIAHRDVKPANVFRTGDLFKVGDFDCVWAKKDRTRTQTTAGDDRYMSPQLRKSWTKGTLYDPFKEDVFQLGASFLHLATRNSPKFTLTSKPLDKAVDSVVEGLSCSEQLKQLLRRMLAFDEANRPTMQEVCSALSSAEETTSSPAQLLPPDSAVHVPTESPSLPSLKETAAPKARIPLTDTREVELAQVTSTFLRFFHTSTWGPQILLHSLIKADQYSTWVVLKDGRLFCSGGCSEGQTLAVAYLLSRDGAINSLPSMQTARGYHGIIQVQDIYVFGGGKRYAVNIHTDFGSKASLAGRIYSALKECEKMNLSDCKWTALPDMQEERCYFNPCEFNGYVYVCGSQLEAFSPLSNSFLPLQLPQLTHIYNPCTLYVHNTLLVIHSENCISKFSAGREGQLEQLSCSKTQTYVYNFSNSQPLLDSDRGCFFIVQVDRSLCIDVETGLELQRFT